MPCIWLSCRCTNAGTVITRTLVQAGAWMGVHFRRFNHNLCSVPFCATLPSPSFLPNVFGGGSTWATWSETTSNNVWQQQRRPGCDWNSLWGGRRDEWGDGSRSPARSRSISGQGMPKRKREMRLHGRNRRPHCAQYAHRFNADTDCVGLT